MHGAEFCIILCDCNNRVGARQSSLLINSFHLTRAQHRIFAFRNDSGKQTSIWTDLLAQLRGTELRRILRMTDQVNSSGLPNLHHDSGIP